MADLALFGSVARDEAREDSDVDILVKFDGPAVATDRLALTPQGYVRYTLKTPYRDGTTHILLEPLDFIARLAALVPKPRVNLTRFHSVFAPNSGLRHHVIQQAVASERPMTPRPPPSAAPP